MWDDRYRPLREGETISLGDECLTDSHLGWQPATHDIGGKAPDPNYTAHRMYRRLRDDADDTCDHPRVSGRPCMICATHYAPAEAARINALADDYKRGLDKMVASGYEEFGIDVLRNHATVIKALRAYAKSKYPVEMAERWTITSRRKMSERISWAWALLFRWPHQHS